MLKKSLAIVVLCTLLGACVTEPRDPDFAGAEAINKDAAAKNRVSLGLTYLSNGNFSQAKANLDKALNFAPKSADAHFAMAYYYQQVDELGLAEDYYQKALKLAPENPNIINSYGAFLCEQGRYEKAKSYFLKAVSSKSYVSTAETYENLAICAVDQGKTDEAINFFQSALNHQPTRGKSLFLLAQLQKQEGNYGEAKKTLWKYDRVSRVSPESLWLSYEIARGLGDTKAALGYGELMKSMFPEHPNTALFKKQMGKFQPVATVKNKRRVVTPVTNENPETTNTNVNESDSAANPAIVKVSKKTKILMPEPSEPKATEPQTTDAEAPATALAKSEIANSDETKPTASESDKVVTEENSSNSDKTIVIVEVPTSPTNDTTKSNEAEPAALTAAEIAKREAELEAALAAEFSGVSSVAAGSSETSANIEAAANAEAAANKEMEETTATIDGAVKKVNDSLATADKVIEDKVITDEVITAEPEVAAATSAKSADAPEQNEDQTDVAEEGYHIVLPKENLYRISIRYNVKMKHLMTWNNLDDPSDIKIGMKLQVKGPKSND